MGTKDTPSKVEEERQSKLIVSNNQLRNVNLKLNIFSYNI